MLRGENTCSHTTWYIYVPSSIFIIKDNKKPNIHKLINKVDKQSLICLYNKTLFIGIKYIMYAIMCIGLFYVI